MKACIYLRKSRADRDNPDTPIEEVLNRHEAILLEYAKKSNLDIVDIKKEVVSGESLTRRPMALKLIEEVEAGLYDAVLVKDIDRLGRGNMIDQGIIVEAFKSSKTKIITPEKTYDLDDDLDEEYVDISAFFARKELKIIKKRLLSGRMKTIEEGHYVSPYAPYGYDKANKTLIINEKEKPVIELIFDLYVNQGYGDTRIAKYLTQNGIPNKHGKPVWEKNTIRKIIQNPVYIGKITWNKREYKYQANKKRTSKFLDKSDWKIVEGKHEAIIGDELFEKAQQLAKERYVPHLHISKPLKNPMAGIIKCAGCGARMTMRTVEGRADTLRCSKHCGSVKSSNLTLVEEKLIDLLLDRLIELENKFKYIEKEKKSNTEYLVLNQALKDTENEKNKLLIQKGSLHDLLEQGVYDVNTFIERSRILADKMQNVEDEIASINDQLHQIVTNNDRLERALPRIKRAQKFIQNTYWNLDPQNKNDFLSDIIDYVKYARAREAETGDFTLDLRLRL